MELEIKLPNWREAKNNNWAKVLVAKFCRMKNGKKDYLLAPAGHAFEWYPTYKEIEEVSIKLREVAKANQANFPREEGSL